MIDPDATPQAVLDNLAFLRGELLAKTKRLNGLKDQQKLLKEQIKEAERDVKNASKRIDDAIATDAAPSLFNGVKAKASAGGWADTPVTSLSCGIEIDMKLAAVHIKTIGDLSVFYKDNGRDFGNIPGLSQSERGTLTDSLNEWMLTRIPTTDNV